MKVDFFFIGKTTELYLKEGIEVYFKRLSNYLPCQITVIPSSSAKTSKQIVIEESQMVLLKLLPRDFVVLLDEKGKELSSREIGDQMQKWMLKGINRLVFVTGGAYGVSDELKEKADFKLALSRVTFTHQMVRLILMEQVYRAMTIIRNESYHHD